MNDSRPDSEEMLDFITFPDDLQNPEFVMLGLHGRNANKYAFFPFVRQMAFLHTKWILPSATFASKSSRDVRHWFDHRVRNPEEIAQSRSRIAALIDIEVRNGVKPENVFLVGFSQGSAMALNTALRYPARLGGVVALSGDLLHPDLLATERSDANRSIPVFWAQGTRDDIITLETGRADSARLRALGYNVDYREYDTTHRISSAEVKDIRAFLHRHMYGMTIEDSKRNTPSVSPF